MATQSHDPRNIVTPDAFSVYPPLLGTPLAKPSRRFWALLLDAFLVFVITASTSSFWYILPFVIGFFFLIRALQKTTTTRFGKVRRFFLGCLGVFVLGISGIVLVGVSLLQDNFDELVASPDGFIDANGTIGEFSLTGMTNVLEGIGEVAAARGAEDTDEAIAAATSVARRLKKTGAPDDEIDEVLEALLPSEVAGLDPGKVIEEVMSRIGEDAPSARSGAAAVDEGAPATALELDSALGEYAAWLRLDSKERDRARGRALRSRIGLDVAADTIEELLDEVEDLQSDLRSAESRVERAETGFGAWLRDKVDTLGFGLGWWTMYFAVLMPWMGGSTPGKRVMGLRVVRLDGQPVTWWHAFERAGGYAAGFATGLLGFVQIYWDPNRQAIHDKIAGTVVVVDGAQRVPGQWEPVVQAELEQQQSPAPETQERA